MAWILKRKVDRNGIVRVKAFKGQTVIVLSNTEPAMPHSARSEMPEEIKLIVTE